MRLKYTIECRMFDKQRSGEYQTPQLIQRDRKWISTSERTRNEDEETTRTSPERGSHTEKEAMVEYVVQ